MKKTFEAILITCNILSYFFFLRMIAGYDKPPTAERIILWTWFVFTIIYFIHKAIKQFIEMKKVKQLNEYFLVINELSKFSPHSDCAKEELIKTGTVFINYIDDIINIGNFKKFNIEHLRMLQSEVKELLAPYQ